jgi:hypothetical protein
MYLFRQALPAARSFCRCLLKLNLYKRYSNEPRSLGYMLIARLFRLTALFRIFVPVSVAIRKLPVKRYDHH